MLFIKLSAKIIDSWQILTFFVYNFCKDYLNYCLKKLYVLFLISFYWLQSFTSFSQKNTADSVFKIICKNAPYKSSQLKNYTFDAEISEKGRFVKLLEIGQKRLSNSEGIVLNKWYGQTSINKVNVKSLNQTSQLVEKLTLFNKSKGKPTPFFWPDFYQDFVGPSCVSPFNYFSEYYYQTDYLQDTLIQSQKCYLFDFKPKFNTDRLFKGKFIISETGFLVGFDAKVSSDAIDYFIRLSYQYALEKWLPKSAFFKVEGGVLGNNGEFVIQEEVISPIEKFPDGTWSKLNENPKVFTEKLNIAERVFDEVFVSQLLGTLHDSMIQKWKQRLETGVVTIDSITYSPNFISTVQLSDSLGTNDYDALHKTSLKYHHFIFSKSFYFGERKKDFYPFEIYYRSPVFDSNFNTAEGFVAAAGLVFRKRWERYRFLELETMGRRSFGLIRNYGFVKLRYKTSNFDISLTKGDYVQQYNPEITISPEMNTLSTLLLKNNPMKIYRKQYLSLFLSKKFSSKFFLKTWLEYATRSQMDNISDYHWINFLDRNFSSNNPTNSEFLTEGFATHDALTSTLHLGFRPFLNYTFINDERKVELGSSPLLLFKYRAGWPNIAQSSTKFHHIEFSYIHNFEFSPWIKTGIQLNTGSFLGKTPSYFIDFKHFNGNYNLLLTGESLASHRLVGYYQNITSGANQRLNLGHYNYSTGGTYLEILTISQFSNLWLKPLLGTKKAYVKELLIANFMYMKNQQLIYNELGYGLDGVFKVFRLEGIASFSNGSFNYVGLRININSRIRIGNVID